MSDKTPIPGNQNLLPGAVEARIDSFFRPYHLAIERQIDAILARGQVPVLLSMHSFTPVMDSFERPWKIGILWNKDPRLPQPLMAKLRAMGIPVGDNEPYSGQDGHGYTQHTHADDRGLANALIEVRQDLIDTHHGCEEWCEILAAALQGVLADPALYEVKRYG